MIMLGCHFMLDVPMPDGSKRTLADAVPFREVYIHALVRDANRQKMSKTKGNVIDPIDIIERFGTDAVRFTLASMASPGTDIAFSEARTEGYRAFANKIWNAARFLFMNIDRAREAGYKIDDARASSVQSPNSPTEHAPRNPLDLRPPQRRLHRSRPRPRRLPLRRSRQRHLPVLLGRTLRLVPRTRQTPPQLRQKAPHAKPNSPPLTLASLTGVFEASLRLLSPFMPFITEEIWHALYNDAPPAKSIALTRYPQPADFPADPIAASAMKTLQDLIVTIRALRKELGVPEKESTPIHLHAVEPHPRTRRRQSGHARPHGPRRLHRVRPRTTLRRKRPQHRRLRRSRHLRTPDRRPRRTRAPHQRPRQIRKGPRRSRQASSTTKPSWPKPPPTSSTACANNTPKPKSSTTRPKQPSMTCPPRDSTEGIQARDSLYKRVGPD